MVNVAVYSTPTCPYCYQVKAYLTQRGIKYTDYDVSKDRAAAQEMISKSRQMGVPVIIINGEVIVGFDRARLEQLLADVGSNQPFHFGIHIADASRVAPKFGSEPVPGAFIGKIVPSSPAERAGLRQGDVITEINSQPVRSADDLEKALSALTGGDRVELVFIREKKALKSEIVI